MTSDDFTFGVFFCRRHLLVEIFMGPSRIKTVPRFILYQLAGSYILGRLIDGPPLIVEYVLFSKFKHGHLFQNQAPPISNSLFFRLVIGGEGR